VTVEAKNAAEQAARRCYGKLLALLARHGIPLSGAEEVLADAFCAALEAWPREGVPDRPEAWLFIVAKRRYISQNRRERVRSSAEETIRQLLEQQGDSPPEMFGDDRLKLLFVCAHPAIDRAMHAPLMLQTVLGFDAAMIGAAFMISPDAMAQRLVRAKAKIRDAGIPFAVPDSRELQPRAHAVLDAIYAAYGSAWEDVAGIDSAIQTTSEEAIWLAQLVVELLPKEAEAKGLLALLLHCEARRGARRSSDGAFIPLAQQDTRLWSQPKIEEAERILYAASTLNGIGRYQLEAAIQSAHASRARTGHTNWPAIKLLYEGLLQLAPTLGAMLGQVAAVAEADGALAGYELLDRVPKEQVSRYQPYWAVRGNIFAKLGLYEDARVAFDKAIALTKDSAVRDFLLNMRSQYASGA
jgi:predicted RNA polymerase sigma factor